MAAPTRLVIEDALALAARAPSAHNTQPWTVRVEGERLSVHPDLSRWLRHGDPMRRDLHLSLGAFVEALRIACIAKGVHAEEIAGAPPALATFTLREREEPDAAEREEASLLRRRQTSRLAYSPRAPEAHVLDEVGQIARRAGLDLHLVGANAADRRDLDAWHFAATRETWLDPRALAELARWLRFDPEGARRPEDGLSTHCLGLSLGETAAMAALLRPGLWSAARAAYVAPVLAGALARAETRAFEQAPIIGVLIAPGDVRAVADVNAPAHAPTPAHAAGSGFLRLWMAATRLGLALGPTSALLDRRGWELGRRLGVSPTRLVAAFRLGRSVPPPLSGRRAVPRFASFASSATAPPP
jgi:nitroreductase